MTFLKQIPDFFGVGMGEGAWEMSMKWKALEGIIIWTILEWARPSCVVSRVVPRGHLRRVAVPLGHVESMLEDMSTMIPPHQGSGAGIAIKGDAWYPAATELNILKKAYTSQKKLVSFYVFVGLLRRQVGFPSIRALIFFM